MVGRKSSMPSLEKLEEMMAELDSQIKIKKGAKAKKLDDPELERKRLWNCYKQRLHKKKIKEMNKQIDESFDVWDNNPDRKQDEYGIAPIDERRYKKCFTSYYKDFPVELDYIRRMTGLSLFQMYILQERTGYKPTPKITEEQAKVDKKQRWLTGDMY